MLCVTTVSYSILVNDDSVGPIVPGRGLRQGDPLSPFLFILCAEDLSAAINKANRDGSLHGSKVCRFAPEISHLLFANDCILFCRASQQECVTLKSILDNYEHISGQAINYSKSGIFFSLNVKEDLRSAISGILGVYNPLNTGRYLGLPSLVGRNKKHIFRYIKEKLFSKLQNWRSKKLSRAGKEILIKAAAQAIPSFCMSIFLLPTTLLDELQRMLNSFWWGSGGDTSKGIKWMSWRKICVRKEVGGRGFRDLHLFNVAMLGKISWRFITDPQALVSRVYKARYFPHSHFLDASLGNRPSYTWASIFEAKDLIRRGVRWKVGSGNQIRIWGSPWVCNNGNFFIQTPRATGIGDSMVCDLLVSGSRTWNKELIERTFSPLDARAIHHTPISLVGVLDRLVWHHDKSGNYLVKSGYRLADTLIVDD